MAAATQLISTVTQMVTAAAAPPVQQTQAPVAVPNGVMLTEIGSPTVGPGRVVGFVDVSSMGTPAPASSYGSSYTSSGTEADQEVASLTSPANIESMMMQPPPHQQQ
uniref:Putative secreted peptide n=1 Tax=Anopheles braziliensis TaxID=58242 RepID=A0A2M3ZPB0_9DIPT